MEVGECQTLLQELGWGKRQMGVACRLPLGLD